MTNKALLQDVIKQRTLLGDGAMGTQLMLAGLEQGNCGEEWNLTHPERVLAIQRRYVDAGSDCLITNTFGGSRIMLNRHGHPDHVAAVNKAGVAIAREAFGDKDGYVLGDIGPFGGLMVPFGDFTEEQVRDAFDEQAAALVEGGADAIIIETQTSLEELQIGVEAAKKAGARCIIGSMAYEHGAHIVALNCGTGMEMERALEAVKRYKKVTGLPVMVQPNGGKPRLINMKVIYDESPEQMVKGVVPLLDAGTNIIGACCGSTPDHIRAFRTAMDEYFEAKGIVAQGAMHEG
jgi:5-methyltetrahydrofolate--homocysteine methyltransferase